MVSNTPSLSVRASSSRAIASTFDSSIDFCAFSRSCSSFWIEEVGAIRRTFPFLDRPEPLGAEDDVERLVPGQVDQAEGDLPLDVVRRDDVEVAHVGDDPEDVRELGVLEVHRDPLPLVLPDVSAGAPQETPLLVILPGAAVRRGFFLRPSGLAHRPGHEVGTRGARGFRERYDDGVPFPFHRVGRPRSERHGDRDRLLPVEGTIA
jgi:hypothetical protein